MDFKDYYKILGVDDKADLKKIKAAYRRLARKYHPDVSTDADAENKFKAIAEAYAVLKDDEKRAEYDALSEQIKFGQQRRSSQQHNYARHESKDFSDFFDSIFKQSQSSAGFEDIYRKHSSNKSQDLEMSLPISLEEAVHGCQKTISFQLPSEHKPKQLKIKIPAQTQDGDSIRLKGQGTPARTGGQAGDLYLKVEYLPHKSFDVTGLDLFLTVPISPWEAALGTKIIIPTLTTKLKLTIPPNSQSGKRQRLKGKGLVSKHKKGDLFVVFKVVMPDKNSVEMNQLWTSLAEKSNFNPRSNWS